MRASYNHAEFLPERRRMMQEWADYLDELKRGGESLIAEVVKETLADNPVDIFEK